MTGARIASITSDGDVWSGVYVVPFVRFLFYEAAVFAGMSSVRLLLLYLQLPLPRLNTAVQWLYMVIIVVYMFFFLTYLGVVGAWLVLSAALEPERFLPFGVAVLALIVVGTTITKQMISAADRLKAALKKAFMLVMQDKMHAAMVEISRRVRESKATLASEEGFTAREMAAGEEEEEEEEDPLIRSQREKEEAAALKRPVDPSEIFAALDPDGNGELSMKEFKELFELLKLDLTDNQKEQLFAFCDADCSNTVNEKEFVEGFDRVVEFFLDNAATTEGLSRLQIAMLIIAVVVMLGLLLFFILVTIFGWSNDSSFTAVIQSMLISGVGKSVTALRKRGRAEEAEGKSVNDLVDQIMEDQRQAAADAADGEGDVADALGGETLAAVDAQVSA